MKIGLFGGTFDPVHLGHVAVAVAARECARLDEVWFLPDGNPPHKASITTQALRAQMVRLSIEGLPPGCRLCEEELNRSGVTYTVDTLKWFKATRPHYQPSYIIGADTLLVLLSWRNVEEVFKLTRLLVVMRPGGGDVAAVRDHISNLRQNHGARIDLLPIEGPDISSSDIRARVHLGQSIDGLVAPGVQRLIEREGLYA